MNINSPVRKNELVRPGTLLRYYACKDILLKLIRDGNTVLDIGCYDGFILSKLKDKRNFVPIAMDVDEDGLKTARGNGLTAILATATCIPIKDKSVDVMMLLDIIEHVEEDRQLIKESYRVLKKGGTLVLTTPVKNKKLVPFVNMHKVHRRWGHLREGYSREELKGLLTCNHFNVLKWSTYFNFPSRYAYAVLFGLPLPLPRTWKLSIYSLVLQNEVKIKRGGLEHLIICSRQ